MAQKKKLLAWMLCLIGLFSVGAVLLYLDMIPFPSIKSKGEERIVCALPMEEVEYVKWFGGGPEFTAQQRDGVWTIQGDGWKKPDQQMLRDQISALCQVVSSREIDSLDPQDDYGLSPAQRQVELGLSNGSAVRYRLGKLNTYTNRYYFQMEQSDCVYLVGYSVGRAMLWTPEQDS